MPVSTFLAKAEALKKKGPMAAFSKDLKLLTQQVKSDSGALRAERVAAQKAGQKPAYCPPEKVKLTSGDVMAAMEAVPAAQRSRTDSKDALRAYFARRFPCRG